jgi:flagellar basal body rod protein FlgG
MGPDALRRAGQAFRYWEEKQAAVAHNLANASTPGFKGERVFARLLEGAGVAPEGATDLRAGAMTGTGRPLDLALDGDGFLVVETPSGERLVRGGSFQLDESRTVVDADGNPLLGESGSIMIPEDAEYEITTRGELRVDGATIARLRVENVADESELQREGGLLFRTEGRTSPVEEGTFKVRQGHLEESNVDPVGALVDMIEIQRAYSALQRSVLVVDGVMDRISNDIGKVR